MSNVLPVSTSPAAAGGSALPPLAAARGVLPLGQQPVAITLNPVDSIDISPEAIEADHQQHEGKVERIRRQLAEGSYIHPDKIDIAIERLLKSLGE